MTSDSRLKREAMRPRSGLSPKGESGGAEGNRPMKQPEAPQNGDAEGGNRPTIQPTYSPLYHKNETNRCPGCGRSHWYVGRIMAECGFCGTAIPKAAA